MPWACKTICTQIGCGVLVAKPGRCAAHSAEINKQYNKYRAQREDPTDKFYHTARWQRLRASILASEPLCRHCLSAGMVTAAVLVDHIIEVKQGGEMWDTDNLQPLCNHCHEIKSVAEGSRFGRGRRT